MSAGAPDGYLLLVNASDIAGGIDHMGEKHDPTQ
jgi:hypothetical protein